jgi:hypothetical protein
MVTEEIERPENLVESFSMRGQQLATKDIVRALLDEVIICDTHESRRCHRFACFGGISVAAFETIGSQERVALIPAVTENVSEKGLSFLCARLLRVETPLSIRFEILENRPVLKCVVRNVAHLGGEYHRIGAEFMERGSCGEM